MNLESKFNPKLNNIEDRLRPSFLARIRNSISSKIAAYSLAGVLAFGSAFALTRCGDEEVKIQCEGNYDCNSGYFCYDGYCVAEELKETEEICDGKDNDFDGDIDENRYGNPLTQDCYTGSYRTKNVGICEEGWQECINGSWSICYDEVTPEKEICDGEDNDCDGEIDEGSNILYKDADDDGYGNLDESISTICTAFAGYVTNNTDCNDNNPDVYPNAPELCDNLDNNCDGEIDEGCPVWNKVYDSGSWDKAFGIAVDSYNNVYVTGYSCVSENAEGNCTNYDYRTIKYDSNGNEIWNKVYDSGYYDYDDDHAYGIAIDSYDNVYVTGYSNRDYRTIKYDSNGNEIWNKVYDGGSYDYAEGIAVDSYDNVYVTGSSDNGSNYDYRTIKYEQN
jgi:hypothetical protein